MAKSIVLPPPVAGSESRIAWRSEPGPLSAVVVTTKTPSVITICVWSGAAPKDWAPRVRVVKTWGPAGGLKIMPSRAASSAASGPLYDSDPVPSPEPVRPAVLDRVSVPSETESVRPQTGLSGPASGSWIAIPSPDVVEKTRD